VFLRPGLTDFLQNLHMNKIHAHRNTMNAHRNTMHVQNRPAVNLCRQAGKTSMHTTGVGNACVQKDGNANLQRGIHPINEHKQSNLCILKGKHEMRADRQALHIYRHTGTTCLSCGRQSMQSDIPAINTIPVYRQLADLHSACAVS